MIVIVLAIINLIATVALLLALFGMANAHKIKIDINFIGTVLIVVMFIICAIFLSLKSLPYYIMYGIIVAMIDLFLIMASGAGLGSVVASLALSFVCWPQCICFLLFLLTHTEVFENDKK